MKYLIYTRAEVHRTYEVEADDPKAAEAQSTFVTPVAEEDIEEETLAIAVAPPHADDCTCDTCAAAFFTSHGHYPTCTVYEGIHVGQCDCKQLHAQSEGEQRG